MSLLTPSQPPAPADDAPAVIGTRPPARSAKTRFSQSLPYVLLWSLLAVMLAAVFWQGLRVRRWSFDIADPIHFENDIRRGCMWGLFTLGPEGFLNQYDKMEIEQPDWDEWLDYAPLRLMVMSRWAAWVKTHYPDKVQPPYTQTYARVVPHADRGSRRPEHLENSYRFHSPLLAFNAVMDTIGAVCAMLLTALWVRRCTMPTRGRWLNLRRHFHGWWQGAIAFIILWFNPAVLIDAYSWPTWDAWVIPMYLLAALLGSKNWWFSAGVTIAVGIMLKGQIIAIMPAVVVWALVANGYTAPLRLACGFVFTAALIVSPWLVSHLPAEAVDAARQVQYSTPMPNWPIDLFAIPRQIDWGAITWVFSMTLSVLFVPAIARRLRNVVVPHAAGAFTSSGGRSSRRAVESVGASPSPLHPSDLDVASEFVAPARLSILHQRWLWNLATAVTIFALTHWPWLLTRNRSSATLGLFASVAISALAIFIPARGRKYLGAAVFGSGLLACMLVFFGGTGWWKCAFAYGTTQFPYMIYGPASNIPALFELRFGWPAPISTVAFTLPAWGSWPESLTSLGYWPASSVAVTTQMLFDRTFLAFLLLSGLGIGLQSRRRDPRVLVALVTPWLLFFLIPVRLHERYLVFAAGAAAICVGHSFGVALLGVLLSVASTIMTLHQMVPDFSGWRRVRITSWSIQLTDQFPWLFTPTSGRTIAEAIDRTHPDIAWGLLVIGLVFLYLTLVPGRKRVGDGA